MPLPTPHCPMCLGNHILWLSFCIGLKKAFMFDYFFVFISRLSCQVFYLCYSSVVFLCCYRKSLNALFKIFSATVLETLACSFPFPVSLSLSSSSRVDAGTSFVSHAAISFSSLMHKCHCLSQHTLEEFE